MPEGKDGAVRLIARQDFALPVTLVSLYLKQLRAIKNSLNRLRFTRGTSSSLSMLMKCEAHESTHQLRNAPVQLLVCFLLSSKVFSLKRKPIQRFQFLLSLMKMVSSASGNVCFFPPTSAGISAIQKTAVTLKAQGLLGSILFVFSAESF